MRRCPARQPPQPLLSDDTVPPRVDVKAKENCDEPGGWEETHEVLMRRPVRCFFVGRRFVGVAALELAVGVMSPRNDGAVGELVLSISS